MKSVCNTRHTSLKKGLIGSPSRRALLLLPSRLCVYTAFFRLGGHRAIGCGCGRTCQKFSVTKQKHTKKR